MIDKNKKIIFLASTEHVMKVREKPVPSSTLIPTWWKKMPVYSSLENKLLLNPSPTVTSKKCFPLLDSITAGYIVKLWADIMVTQTPDGPYIQWNTSQEVVASWPYDMSKGFEIPEGFSKTVFKYMHGWIIKTPKNYSCLITHPVGYQNLPFKTLSGIIDTDKLNTFANSPFVVKSNFEGIIEKGTPMFQVLPFKRDNWNSEYVLMEKNENFFNEEKLHSKIISSYGKFLRTKKHFK
jgi:hypothetical protein